MTNLILNEANFWLGLEKKKILDPQQNPYFPHTLYLKNASRLTACFQMILDAPFSFQNKVFESGCVTQRSDTGSRFLPPPLRKSQAGVPAQAAGGGSGCKKRKKRAFEKSGPGILSGRAQSFPPMAGGFIGCHDDTMCLFEAEESPLLNLHLFVCARTRRHHTVAGKQIISDMFCNTIAI